ncbi:MAG: NUDIX domain-containing protein [Parcubacteria group bacterium]|jgi:isopentenyl-diphosphate delta-isomerase
MSKLNIVDEDDNVIGIEDRKKAKKESFYRVSALWVTNSRGEILLARRHRSKTHDPLKWGPAVSGTVEAGESYEENILKEAEEELGLKNIHPKIGPKIKMEVEYHYFVQWFTLGIEKDASDFEIQEDEVVEIKWFPKKDLISELQNSSENFTPGLRAVSKLFLGE